ncbi:hypothetical protein Catovirus_1_17 [Catovirus CTV1]|uniref:Uncharacterized protein n=1 Tax=Catovirus CTV1 TaxID=1977631 RepID=A0A1V0S8D2_9VIRU|nr:hypothetical protein Catovirus_1_17 [Catovirus CTV1]
MSKFIIFKFQNDDNMVVPHEYAIKIPFVRESTELFDFTEFNFNNIKCWCFTIEVPYDRKSFSLLYDMIITQQYLKDNLIIDKNFYLLMEYMKIDNKIMDVIMENNKSDDLGEYFMQHIPFKNMTNYFGYMNDFYKKKYLINMAEILTGNRVAISIYVTGDKKKLVQKNFPEKEEHYEEDLDEEDLDEEDLDEEDLDEEDLDEEVYDVNDVNNIYYNSSYFCKRNNIVIVENNDIILDKTQQNIYICKNKPNIIIFNAYGKIHFYTINENIPVSTKCQISFEEENKKYYVGKSSVKKMKCSISRTNLYSLNCCKKMILNSTKNEGVYDEVLIYATKNN